MVSGEVPNFVYDTRTRHLWSCSYGRGGNELCPLPLSRAVQRSRDGTRLQSFPHYAPEWGMYISQDPIRLEAGLTNLYAYVHDTNGWIDPLGLAKTLTLRAAFRRAKQQLRIPKNVNTRIERRD